MSEPAPAGESGAAEGARAKLAVPESPFDLIALERTRLAFRILAVAFFLRTLVALPYPLLAMSVGVLTTLLLVAAILVSAPTPHGPFPNGFRWACAIALLAGLPATFTQSPVEDPDAGFGVVAALGLLAAGLELVALPLVFWRYCQNRGLSGKALLWLWIAMAFPACMPLLAMASGIAWGMRIGWSGGDAALAFVGAVLLFYVAYAVVAWRTGNAVWLDALNRHARVFARSGPGPAVEPLRPADVH